MVATDVEVKEIVLSLVSKLEPDIRVSKIILFGSYASGEPKNWSDIDLAIISPNFSSLPIWRRQEVLAESLPEADARLSPLGYSPEELSKPSPFLREIIHTGRVVYEAPKQ
jgi:predicted nucleotidyltransferase